jgi:hypothetical protein
MEGSFERWCSVQQASVLRDNEQNRACTDSIWAIYFQYTNV